MLSKTKSVTMKHPIQPISKDTHGVYRFKSNSIVRFLLDEGPFDLNQLAIKDFSQEDREQFAQLIGYSLSGFGELSYVSDESYETAEKMLEGKNELEARNQYLRETLSFVKENIKDAAATLFNIHPDDLEV